MIVLVLLACGHGKPDAPPNTAGKVATVESTVASCAQYLDVPEVYGVCLSSRVPSLGTVADVDALCPQAGAWEPQCRQAWVDEQVRLNRKVVPADLVAACGPNADCAFQIAETWPASEILDQIRTCETHVRAYESDCIGHALHRWVMSRPPASDAERVLSGAPTHVRQIAAFLGMSEACGGTFTCLVGSEAVAADCRVSAESYRQEPSRCPVR